MKIFIAAPIHPEGTDILKKEKGVDVIGRVGVDNRDIVAASRRGIVIMNTPTGNTIAARKLPAACFSILGGEWNRKRFTGIQLLRRTLGIIGLGRIGSEVAKRAKAFEMRMISYDPSIKCQKAGRSILSLIS